MDVQLLVVPYDSALRNVRMGAGPARLLAAGLPQRLREAGHRVGTTEVLAPEGSRPAEIRTAFELDRRLAFHAAAARAKGALPITLAGNCNTAVGTIAGLGDGPTAVLWFDAHGDFHTPESTTSGFLDGMALGLVTGRCWGRMAASVPGFVPVAEENVVLVGGVDLDPPEAELLAVSGVTHLSPAEAVAGGLAAALAPLARRTRQLYVHVDLDVLDGSEGRANEYAGGPGLSLDDLLALLGEAARHCRIAAAAATAYDPAYDPGGTICRAGLRVVGAVADLAAVPVAARPVA